MTYLPAGCSRPDPTVLNAFRDQANAALSAEITDFQVRWIGLDHDSTEEVLALIASGDKTGTFTLPWIVAATDQPEPAVGDLIVLIDFAGQPRLLIQLEAIEMVNFGDVTAAHTAIDGSPVRDLKIWKPLHTQYWNALLAPFDMSVADTMPVWIERFTLLYP